jgi:hypothetical protein
MRKISDAIWVHEDTMPLMGTRLPLRMTVIQLNDQRLWVHSPTAPTSALLAAINRLGPVGCLVAAGNHHHRWLQAWHQAFPDATLYVSRGIPQKTGISQYQLLNEQSDALWRPELAHATMPATPFFDESVFLHHASQSLIVTDLIQNYTDHHPGSLTEQIMHRLFTAAGFKGLCIAPPLKLGFVIQDKTRFATFVRTIQNWDFDKIIVTHGAIITNNAPVVFSQLCARFLN